MKIRCSHQYSFLHHYATTCPVFTIELTNTKFKLHTPNLYYIGKEKWKQMKPKRFLSCPVLTAVDALFLQETPYKKQWFEFWKSLKKGVIFGKNMKK